MLLITIDTLRADHLSAYGYARRTSPSLDALAAEGALFEVAYSESNTTNPSHATILTGVPMRAHGVVNTPQGLDAPGVATLAERFRAAGYATAAIVSARHLNRGPSGFGRGFGSYLDVEETERPAGDSVALAREWIEANAHEPFFVWLHLFDPHTTYDPPPPYDTRFPSPPAPRIDVIFGRLSQDEFFRTHAMPAAERAALSADFSRNFEGTIGYNRIGLTSAEVAHLNALYDGEIAYVDAMLGDLFADLKRLGLDDHMLVVVTSDHGEAFGEHGLYAIHRTIYEETLRVPLILRYPGRIPAGQRLQTPVQHLDIAPTVLGYAGLSPSESLRGESLAPLLSDGAAPPIRPLFADHTRLYAGMVRDGPWKLIVSRPEMKAKAIAAGVQKRVLVRIHPDAQELYDLASDPGETRNLADSQAAITERLQRLGTERFPPETRTPSARAVDAETSERLRALGYTD